MSASSSTPSSHLSWRLNDRFASLMDSIYTIIAGLGLRFVVDTVTRHDFKITGTLVGLWEGVILLHFLKKLPKSTDPLLAFAVRLFIDFIVTESLARLVLVVTWTGMGMILADVAPAIWEDTGLRRIWRRFRRDLYVISESVPTVVFFPPTRTVRFSPSREPSVIAEEEEEGEGEGEGEGEPDGEARSVVSSTSAGGMTERDTSANIEQASIRRRLPGYFPGMLSDTESVLSSVIGRGLSSTFQRDSGRTSRRLSVYPMRTEDDDFASETSSQRNIEDDIKLSSSTSSNSTITGEPADTTRFTDDIRITEDFDTTQLTDIPDEEVLEEQKPAGKIESVIGVIKKDVPLEVQTTPKQPNIPLFLPPTPSDSQPPRKRRLAKSDHVRPPSASIPQIPDMPEDVPSDGPSDGWEKIQREDVNDAEMPWEQVQKEDAVGADKPPTPPPKDWPETDGPLFTTSTNADNVPGFDETSTAGHRRSQPPPYSYIDDHDDIYEPDPSITKPLEPVLVTPGLADPTTVDVRQRADELAANKQREAEENERKRLEQEAAEKKRQEEAAEKKRLKDDAAEKLRKEEEETAEKRKLEEQERARKEADAEKKRLEEERILKEAERKRLEEEERIRKELEAEAEGKWLEEALRAEAELKRLEEEALKAEAEKRRLEEEERVRKEAEAERKRLEEARKAEAERMRLEAAEAERRRLEQVAERARKEAEAAKLEEARKAEAERKRLEEEEQARKAAVERRRLEEEAAERARKEAEAAKKRLEEEAAERARKEAEAAKKRLEDEERARKDAEKKRLEEEARKETEQTRLKEATPKKTEGSENEAEQTRSKDALDESNEEEPQLQTSQQAGILPTPSTETQGGDGQQNPQTVKNETQVKEEGDDEAEGDEQDRMEMESVATDTSTIPTDVEGRLTRILLTKAQIVEIRSRIDELESQLGPAAEEKKSGMEDELQRARKALEKMEKKEKRRRDNVVPAQIEPDPNDRDDLISFDALGDVDAKTRLLEKLEELLSRDATSLHLTLTFAAKGRGKSQKQVVTEVITTFKLLEKSFSPKGREIKIDLTGSEFSEWLTEYRNSITQLDENDNVE